MKYVWNGAIIKTTNCNEKIINHFLASNNKGCPKVSCAWFRFKYSQKYKHGRFYRFKTMCLIWRFLTFYFWLRHFVIFGHFSSFLLIILVINVEFLLQIMLFLLFRNSDAILRPVGTNILTRDLSPKIDPNLNASNSVSSRT